MAKRIGVIGLACLLQASIAAAVDYPVQAGGLRLLDPPAASHGFVKFVSGKYQSNLTALTIADPRPAGATLEIFGSGGGDGSSGLINLPGMNWRGLGSPAGSTGYYFRDHDATNGIAQIYIRPAPKGGFLIIAGGGPAWTYAVAQPQTDVMVRLTIGADRYCAKFTNIKINRAGVVVARKNPPIANCN